MEKICKNGHRFSKTSDCPVCPICELEKRKSDPCFSAIGSPALRALDSKEITTLSDLALFTEMEILALHGIGPNAMSKLKAKMTKNGLTFKSTN
jgi:hypothetical protein